MADGESEKGQIRRDFSRNFQENMKQINDCGGGMLKKFFVIIQSNNFQFNKTLRNFLKVVSIGRPQKNMTMDKLA